MVDPRHKTKIIAHLQELKAEEFSTPDKIISYAKLLRGMTFTDVLELKLSELEPNKNYSDPKRKGGLG
ncbi:MAG: hypothetical protein Q3965_04970, partial [Rothia sp. (in: high G+C Gram-positive bacteria)]|nr:hypothetical protein [Rothia sp. (in: high G+C Gram-positive bacteria)]